MCASQRPLFLYMVTPMKGLDLHQAWRRPRGMKSIDTVGSAASGYICSLALLTGDCRRGSKGRRACLKWAYMTPMKAL